MLNLEASTKSDDESCEFTSSSRKNCLEHLLLFRWIELFDSNTESASTRVPSSFVYEKWCPRGCANVLWKVRWEVGDRMTGWDVARDDDVFWDTIQCLIVSSECQKCDRHSFNPITLIVHPDSRFTFLPSSSDHSSALNSILSQSLHSYCIHINMCIFSRLPLFPTLFCNTVAWRSIFLRKNSWILHWIPSCFFVSNFSSFTFFQ